MAIWGPNGTGKSGVIYSIDFLLTGRIGRLQGQGTKNITLKTHGVHIEADTHEAYVQEEVKLDHLAEPVELRRQMSSPSDLDIELFQPIIDIAERGQHVLTRREIVNSELSDGHQPICGNIHSNRTMLAAR